MPRKLTHREKAQEDHRLARGWCLGPVPAGSGGSGSAAHDPELSDPQRLGQVPFSFSVSLLDLKSPLSQQSLCS